MWDVVVIGSGIAGCATARELARYRLKVLVLEKGSDVCSGASKGNSAMVHSGFDPEPNTLKARFNVLGNALFDELCSELDVPFSRSGTLVIAASTDEMQELRRLQERGRKNGVETQLLTGGTLREFHTGPRVVGALFAPSGGVVCPYNLVIAMAECAFINGVEFLFETQVLKIGRDGGTWRVTAGGGREFYARAVVNCAGTDSARLNNMVCAEKFTVVPRFGAHIILSRDYIHGVDCTVTQTPKPLPSGGHTKGMGMIPSADGTVILGCDAVDHADPDDTAVPAESIRDIVNYFTQNWEHYPIARFVPVFPREGIIGAYGGLRAHCDRDDFVIGEPDDAPGFFNAAGIESPGLTAGPAIGQYLSTLISKRLGAVPKPDFYPGRHALKPFRGMTDRERAEAIAQNPDYAKIVCRCELVTEAEIRDAIRRPLGARSISGVKMRTRAGMGRCQGGFCGPRVLQILCEEQNLDPLSINQSGPGSNVLQARACALPRGRG